MDPRGKVAVITGAGSGIGRATALALARAGASVVVADIDDNSGAETVSMVEHLGARAAFVHTDVISADDIDHMVASAVATFGGLDILHANAGINTPRPHFPTAPRAAWERTLFVDLWAVVACIQAAVPVMRERGGGAIVCTSSLAGLIGYAPDPIYCAAKHGVVGLTRSLGFLNTEANIRINCVCPTVVDTPMVTKRNAQVAAAGLPPEASTAMPLITAEEVAEAVMEFVRDDSLFGQVMGIVYGRSRRLVPPPMSLV